MRRLRDRRICRYKEMFEDANDKSELVATFLAILELIKGKRVRVLGDGEECELKLIGEGEGEEEEWNEMN